MEGRIGGRIIKYLFIFNYKYIIHEVLEYLEVVCMKEKKYKDWLPIIFLKMSNRCQWIHWVIIPYSPPGVGIVK